MNNAYNLLQFLHVVAAMLWVGGSAALMLMHARLSRSRPDDETEALVRQSGWLGRVLFGPAALVTLLAGIGMLAVAGIGMPFWAGWGLLVVLASLLMSVILIRPTALQLARGDTADASSSQRASLRTRLGALNTLNLLLLLSAVWAMVAKPAMGA